MTELTKEQQELLKRLTEEMTNLATSVVDDYEMTPSEMSGSITEVHIESPILDEEDYPYNTEFGDGKTPKEMDKIDEENKKAFEDSATKDRKRWSG